MLDRRLAILVVAAALALFVACAPMKGPAPGSSGYEHLVADHVNELRSVYGRSGVAWSDQRAAEARATAQRCADINGGDDVSGASFPACHSDDYDGEVLFFWPGSCAETADRAYQAVFGGPVQGWRQTPPDLAYLLAPFGLWPPASSVGVGVVCDTSSAWGSGLYIVARLGH